MLNSNSSTEIIRVFEDRQMKVNLSQQNLLDLVEMRKVIGENNVIVQADGKLLIKHYIGFIQINKTRLLVYPKIAVGLEEKEEIEKSFGTILKMLSFTKYQSIREIPNAQNISQFNNDLLEFYISIFIKELTKQIQRDINRGYNNRLENQSFIKGKVDFGETIKHNSFRKHLHYVSYDDFNENTLLNRVFKSILEVLITRTKVKRNRVGIKQLLVWMEDIDKTNITNELWDRVVFTRQNSKYKTAFNMAKLFYYNNSPKVADGDVSILSFMIPVNQLFEVYLVELLKRNITENTEVKFQGPIDYLAKIEKKHFLQLRPDISLMRAGEVIRIVDAKYKLILEDDEKLMISQADIYQMLAYSVRYKCNRICLVYPKALTDSDAEFSRAITIENYDQTVSIHVIKIDLEENVDSAGKKLIDMIEGA